MTAKIEAFNNGTPEPLEYGNVFKRQEVGNGTRLRVGLNDGHDVALATLIRTLRGPFQLLYVLHTTRTSPSSVDTRALSSPSLRSKRFSESSASFSARTHDMTCGSARMTTTQRSSSIVTT